MKSLKEISWDVSEETYRQDSALSYSTIARYDRIGFDGLPKLNEKISTPSLTFGSAVDAIITGGQEEFDNHFVVMDFAPVKDSIKSMVDILHETFKQQYLTIYDIPDKEIIAFTEYQGFQLNWKPETRARVIKEQGGKYYDLLFIAAGKAILNTEVKQQVDDAVAALRTSPATYKYFSDGFDDLERDYQLKFKATFDNVDYRIMADLITVDHNKKEVQPIDLKTSSKPEWDFYKSFVEWSYSIQARLYWRVIRANMDKDPVFKDYKLNDYLFVVINKQTLVPLVWEYPDTQKYGTLHYSNNQIKMRDPFAIGTELNNYLKNKPDVPEGISKTGFNNIIQWLNKQ